MKNALKLALKWGIGLPLLVVSLIAFGITIVFNFITVTLAKVAGRLGQW